MDFHFVKLIISHYCRYLLLKIVQIFLIGALSSWCQYHFDISTLFFKPWASALLQPWTQPFLQGASSFSGEWQVVRNQDLEVGSLLLGLSAGRARKWVCVYGCVSAYVSVTSNLYRHLRSKTEG